MNEVSVDGPSHRALDAHQAVFLGPLEDGIRLQDLRDAVVPVIGLDPADVLAPSEAPALKTESAQVEAIGRAAPEYEMKLVLKDGLQNANGASTFSPLSTFPIKTKITTGTFLGPNCTF